MDICVQLTKTLFGILLLKVACSHPCQEWNFVTDEDFEARCQQWGVGSPTEVSHKITRSFLETKTRGPCATAASSRETIHLCQIERKCFNPSHEKHLPYRSDSQQCPVSENEFTITGWSDNSKRWKIRNLGHGLEVTFHHGRLYTDIKYRGHSRRLTVEKILITSGSQHKVFGRHRRAEIQLYHREHHIIGKHAFSFLVRSRSSQDNQQWNIFQARGSRFNLTEIGSKGTIRRINLRKLIFERSGRRNKQYSTRYSDKDESDCEKYTWTILGKSIFFSKRQMEWLERVESFKSTPFHKERNILIDDYCENKPS